MTDTTDLIRRAGECLEYRDGALIWKVSRRRKLQGLSAGYVEKDGYTRIRLFGRVFQAHRLVWTLYHGEWPDGSIDHINGQRSDNRIENLRVATPTQQQANKRVTKSTGLPKGVVWDRGAYQAQIKKHRKSYYLGRFSTVEAAKQAYDEKAKESFGEFARP